MSKPHFSIDYPGLQQSILTGCQITERFSNRYLGYTALWDTGATTSAISSRVVQELGLFPMNTVDNVTAGGVIQTQIYYVGMILPGNIYVPQLLVSEFPLVGFDAIIGMDIICQGDFHIDHPKGDTRFFFQLS